MASLGSLIPEYLAQFVFANGVGQVIVPHTRCYQQTRIIPYHRFCIRLSFSTPLDLSL